MLHAVHTFVEEVWLHEWHLVWVRSAGCVVSLLHAVHHIGELGSAGRRWGGMHGHRALAMSVIPGSGVGSHQNLFLRAIGRRIDFAKSCSVVRSSSGRELAGAAAPSKLFRYILQYEIRMDHFLNVRLL